MTIHLIDNLYLRSDERNFIIAKKTGEDKFLNTNYFSKLDSLLKFLLNMKLQESDSKTLKELFNEYLKLADTITLAVGQIKTKGEIA
ncbi:hypothetical protein VQL36_04705 [Chengkuizengella sp. SCS-71B]|uniref:hypothetical protein n=1 Tax=Chengkuizengella sp. SCS-71B TaxID=3115290 RepID=UPI0032C22593